MIVLCNHGEAGCDNPGERSAWKTPLLGRWVAVAQELRTMGVNKFSRVYAAPFWRAFETGLIINDLLSAGLSRCDLLTDQNCGTFERVDGRETSDEMENRIRAFLGRTPFERQSVIVAHERVNRSILKILLGLQVPEPTSSSHPENFLYRIIKGNISHKRIGISSDWKSGMIPPTPSNPNFLTFGGPRKI